MANNMDLPWQNNLSDSTLSFVIENFYSSKISILLLLLCNIILCAIADQLNDQKLFENCNEIIKKGRGRVVKTKIARNASKLKSQKKERVPPSLLEPKRKEAKRFRLIIDNFNN